MGNQDFWTVLGKLGELADENARLREALEDGPDEEAREVIMDEAARALRNHSRGIRGQIMTEQDGLDYWVMMATLDWARAALKETGQ